MSHNISSHSDMMSDDDNGTQFSIVAETFTHTKIYGYIPHLSRVFIVVSYLKI